MGVPIFQIMGCILIKRENRISKKYLLVSVAEPTETKRNGMKGRADWNEGGRARKEKGGRERSEN